ncbi:MAG: hypothetical protein ACRDF4_08730, partial [Rhabdochlamydiaceae bacterium]
MSSFHPSSLFSAQSLVKKAAGLPADNTLSSHWVPGWGYRDEINTSDADNQNFWLDNVGKILTTSIITHDPLNANRSFNFIHSYLFNSTSYLPELVINSSSPLIERSGSGLTISNRIVEITANNKTSSQFNQLAIGTSYSGNINLAYIGAYRLWFDNGSINAAFTPVASTVFQIPNGFSERLLFDIGGQDFYTYTNATLQKSDPFVNVSLQLDPLNAPASTNEIKYMFLQIFNTTETDPFYSGGLYSLNGTFLEPLPFRNATTLSQQAGIMLSYSGNTTIFSTPQGGGAMSGQDAVAIRFGNQSIYDYEHWANDAPFGHSWFAPGYYAPSSNGLKGQLSQPIYAQVYPILDFDYRVANGTAEYIASNTTNTATSPPVSFGFDALGLALYAQNNSQYLGQARAFWNYYYSAYSGSNYSSAYARAINTFALAGFKLYGCNSTVENFTRTILANTSGTSIEEFAWGTAALYQLQECTGSARDISLYDSFASSFMPSNLHFADLSTTRVPVGAIPSFTFQFGEAAEALMLGAIPYNSPIVLALMSAVYQSNVAGTVLNQPFHGDLANTETLPAYMLSTWLFQNEMTNSTGCSIVGLDNANLTSIHYSNGTLLLGAIGNNGSILISHGSTLQTLRVTSSEVIPVSLVSSTTTTTTTTIIFHTTTTSTVITTTTRIVPQLGICSRLPLE